MTIIDRLLFREVLKTLAVILIILLLVLLASFMVKLLGKAAAGGLGPNVLLLLVGLYTLQASAVLLPPAFFFALLWVLGSMYRDSEMVALQSSGVGIGRLMRSVALIAVPLALASAYMVFYLLPLANSNIQHIQAAQQAATDISAIRPGRFNEFDGGNLVIYAQGASDHGKRLQQVFVKDRQRGRSGLVVANEAYQVTDAATGDRYIILADGRRYQGVPGTADYQIARFAEYGIRVPKLALDTGPLRTSAQSTQTLWGEDSLKARAELQYRFSVPTAVLVFALLAVPLARAQPRKDIYGRIVLAILIYVVFLNLQRVSQRWMADGSTPAWLGMWWVALLMLGIAGVIALLDSSWLAGRLRRLKRARI